VDNRRALSPGPARLAGMNNDQIPAMRRPEDVDPIRNQSDLCRHWRMLMGELGFGRHSLWLHLLHEDGRPSPVLAQIDDLPTTVDPAMADDVIIMCTHLLSDAPGSTVALLLSRPGSAVLAGWEQAWARELHAAADRHGVPIWPVHRANDERLEVVSPDDLAA
jgi:hypothetical protein